MLTELLSQIRDELGVGIGYSHPFIGHHVESEDEFVIFEGPNLGEEDNAQLLFRDDVEFSYQDQLVYSRIAQFPEHDEKVEGLLTEIDEAILDGRIWFDPGCIRKVEDYTFDIIMRGDIFKIEVTTPEDEALVFIYDYQSLKKASKKHKYLKHAVKIVNEFWPRPTLMQRILNRIKSAVSWLKNLKRG